MDPKPRPQRRAYLQVLRNMTPEERVQKAFEMSAFTKQLFKQGLRERFPELSDADLHEIYLARLAKCHNKNY